MIITGAGVIVFLLAGLLTILVTESGNEQASSPVKKTSLQSQEQPQNQTLSGAEASSIRSQTSRTIYAYITGEVNKPGVYKLSDDARIFQLVDMAGGFTSKADKDSLNLAEILADGTHVHIGAVSQVAHESPLIPGMPAKRPATQSSVSTNSSTSLININTATASELDSLPGIGPAIAQRIIDYRNAHGSFARPEDLVNVRGIGQSKLAQILPHITATSAGSRVTQSQSSAGKVDINRANAKDLERLTGVGPVTAKRIIEYRQSHGAFTKPEDLTNVRGINWSKLDKIRGQIVIR